MKRHGYNETELRAMTVTRLETTINAINAANGGKRGDIEHRTYTAKRRRKKKS